MFGYSTVDQVSDMPEVADFVPELVCLGIDVAICGVIPLNFPHKKMHTNEAVEYDNRVCLSKRRDFQSNADNACQALYTALRGTSTVLRQLSAAPELPLDEQLVTRFP